MMEALTSIKYRQLKPAHSYKHVISLRLWECNIGDEGVAHLCQFLNGNKSVETLDLLKNKITATGCDFLGRVLGSASETPVKILHLDHNPIGSAGVDKLANGLAQNKKLTVLSLTHAGLDHKCAPAISRILIYIESQLKELLLRAIPQGRDYKLGETASMFLVEAMLAEFQPVKGSPMTVEDFPRFVQGNLRFLDWLGASLPLFGDEQITEYAEAKSQDKAARAEDAAVPAPEADQMEEVA